LLGKKAINAKLDDVIVDIGSQKSVKGSRIYAVLAGVLDAGLKVPHKKEILPDKERLNGAHITKYAEMLKKNDELLKKQFGSYLKSKSQPENITKKFEEMKKNIENDMGK